MTWSDPIEAKQAVEKLLPLWGQEVGVDDALELLGPGFTNRGVRAFAVHRLERAEDEVRGSSHVCDKRLVSPEGTAAVPVAISASTEVRIRCGVRGECIG